MSITVQKKLRGVFLNAFVSIVSLMFALNISYATWTYTPVDWENGQITQDDWVLNVWSYGGAPTLTITGVPSVGASGILHLEDEISDDKVIVAIGGYAFDQKSSIVKVYLPASGLKRIGDRAFNGCIGLVLIDPFLPDSVEFIDEWAFANTPSLTIPLVLKNQNLEVLPNSSFRSSGITSVDMSSS